MKRRIVRVMCVVLLTLLLCPCAALGASALEEPSVENVGAAFIYNIENKQTIFEYSADTQLYPAASVKVMSAVTAYEALRGRMDEKIEITSEMIAEARGNNIAIEAGERSSVRDLLYAMLLKGANDATYVLGHVAFGSTDAFISRMNERAKELGMINTYYTNPTGMHDDAMLTTARDQAKVAEVFCSYSELLEMSSVSKHVIEKDEHCTERNIYTRNAFVSKLNSLGTIEYYYKDAKGINYGSTEEGGDSFVTVCEREGLRYVCVVLGGKQNEEEHIFAFDAARALCEYALGGFGYVRVLKTDKLVYDIPVTLSETADKVMLVPSAEIKAYLPTDVSFDDDITYSYTLTNETLTAPVAEGMEVGHISVFYRDRLLGTVPLITQNEVEMSVFLSTLESIKKFTQGKFFICTVIALAVVTVGFVLINSYVRASRRRRNTRPRSYTRKR